MLTTPKGNLLQNPGFELGLEFWEVPQTLPNAKKANVSAQSAFPHSGLASLALNVLDDEHLSVVYQDVRVSPGKCYQLDCVVSGLGEGHGRLSLEVRWLDDDCEDLGLGLSLLIPDVGRACDGEWDLHSGVTDEAPLGARRARISVASADKCVVLVDDLAFYKID
jgi:hypothetical protein